MAAQESDGQTHLAGRRTRQQLAQGHDFSVGTVREPSPTFHELIMEEPKVRCRPAKRGQPEPEEQQKNLPRGQLFFAW